MQLVFSIAFLVSTLLLPWWMASALALILVSFWGGWASGVVIFGGLVMDSAFGAPVASLGGFSYLYTTLFLLIAILAFVLKRRMLE